MVYLRFVKAAVTTGGPGRFAHSEAASVRCGPVDARTKSIAVAPIGVLTTSTNTARRTSADPCQASPLPRLASHRSMPDSDPAASLLTHEARKEGGP
jgi:hypothetical protein